MATDNSIEKQTMTAMVAEQLRKDILQGRFYPGQHLTVQSISSMYQTSAIPVREAFSILNGEDLLDIIPYKGVAVREINQQTVINMYDILRAMEVLMVENICGNWTEELRAAAVSVNEQIGAIRTDEEVHTNFNDLNRQFHDPLEQFCCNERAKRLTAQYHHYITLMTETGRRHSLQRVKEVYREHCEIISAVDSQNPVLIRETYLKHSINAEKELLWQLNKK